LSTSHIQQADSPTVKEIEGIVRDLLDNDEVVLTMATKPADVDGWDSLANVSIVFSVEEAFGIQLGDEAMSGFETVGDLVAIIDDARSRRAA
jgi:acyl carrier protein